MKSLTKEQVDEIAEWIRSQKYSSDYIGIFGYGKLMNKASKLFIEHLSPEIHIISHKKCVCICLPSLRPGVKTF